MGRPAPKTFPKNANPVEVFGELPYIKISPKLRFLSFGLHVVPPLILIDAILSFVYVTPTRSSHIESNSVALFLIVHIRRVG